MSDNTYSEVLPSDHCWFLPVRHLLKTITLGAWLRAKPPSSVITLQASTTCGQALRTLAAAEISSAPVFDGNVYVGFLDVADILAALLSIVSVRELTDENRECKLRNAGLQLEHQQLRSLNISQDGALIYKADLQSTLHDVLLYGFLQPNVAGYMQVVHRVGVFEADEEASSDDDMACDLTTLQGISITHIVSQSDIVHFLHKHVDELGPLADVTVRQLGLADKAVVCVPGEMSTINAFASMVANKVSCVGVISHAHGGGLAASLSSSDLRGLLPEHFVALASPVLHYLTAKASSAGAFARLQSSQPPQQQQRQQSPPSPHPVQLQHQHSAGSAQAWGLKGGEGVQPLKLISCSPSSTLRQVLQLLASNMLHRLHVLDDHARPVGIVTITDLLRLIVGATELLEAYGPDIDLEQEVEQLSPSDPPDCSMGMDIGRELIEPRKGLMPVHSSQALLDTAVPDCCDYISQGLQGRPSGLQRGPH